MVIRTPTGRGRVITDADIADNTALIVEAVNTHATLKARIEVLEAALYLADRLCKEALPQFKRCTTALDTNATSLLNEVPIKIRAALSNEGGGK